MEANAPKGLFHLVLDEGKDKAAVGAEEEDESHGTSESRVKLGNRLAEVGPCGAGGKLILLRGVLADLPAEPAVERDGGWGRGSRKFRETLILERWGGYRASEDHGISHRPAVDTHGGNHSAHAESVTPLNQGSGEVEGLEGGDLAA